MSRREAVTRRWYRGGVRDQAELAASAAQRLSQLITMGPLMDASGSAERVTRHVAAFNAAVWSGDWAAFAARFTPDATMHFTGVPAGPFTGRDQIARAYAEQPPTETLTVTEVSTSAAVDTVRFAWASGGTGIMELTWDGQLISRLAVSFDR